MKKSEAKQASNRAAKVPVARVLNLFSSIWFGVTMLTSIFLYSSLGSAMPFVRQYFELTEMQWFATWPFYGLILLFCTALITVTLRRIRFRVLNYGVWMIHTGIIILCIGSVIYFGQKVEGDSAVYRRKAKITVPGLSEPVEMVCRPNSNVQFEANGHQYSVSLPPVHMGGAWIQPSGCLLQVMKARRLLLIPSM